MGAVLAKLLQIFWTKKLDIVVIGLENRYAKFGKYRHKINTSMIKLSYALQNTNFGCCSFF